MTHRGPCQPLTFCDSVNPKLVSQHRRRQGSTRGLSKEQQVQGIPHPLPARAGREQHPSCCMSCNVRPFSARFLQALSLVVPEDPTQEVEESQREVVSDEPHQ